MLADPFIIASSCWEACTVLLPARTLHSSVPIMLR